MKTLYFEGAGCVPRGEVENCRIRTAFTNDEGKQIYLEMGGTEATKYSPKPLQKYKNIGYVDSCHYITDEEDDENKQVIVHRARHTFEYTKENILAFVNSLGCSFEQVVILPDLAGYRVFGEKHGDYRYGDQFDYDAELTGYRQVIYDVIYEKEKSEGKEYPNFSLWVDDEDKYVLHLLRHFEGYNTYWEIRIGVAQNVIEPHFYWTAKECVPFPQRLLGRL